MNTTWRGKTCKPGFKGILVPFLMVATFALTLYAQPSRTAKIHGQVLVSASERLPDVVRVTLYTINGSYVAAKTLTADTSFVFAGVPFGSYELTVESPGFYSSSKTVVVRSPTSRYEIMVTIPLGQPMDPETDKQSRPPAGEKTVDTRALAIPDAATKLLKRAEQEAKKGNHQKAITHLEKAAQVFPEGHSIYNNLAIQYLAVGEFDKAVSALREAIRRNPEDPTSRRNMAQLHLKKGEYEETLEQLDESLALDPNNSKTLMLLGETYLGLEDCVTAMDNYLAAVELNPVDHSYLGMAQCYAVLGQFEQAVAELRAFLARHPEDPRVPEVEELIRQLEN